MKNNTKALALTLLATTIIATGASFASNTTSTGVVNTFKQMTGMTTEQKAQMETLKTLLDKQKAGTTLTTQEQTQLDELKANMPERKWRWWHGGRWGDFDGDRMWGWFGGWPEMSQLTDEEKTALESMSDDEKKAFFETKRSENEAKMEARENVIDKLLNGEALSADEEKIKEEIKLQRAEMKAKRAEMKELRTLMEKQKAGTTLTADEQAKVDAFQATMPEQKWKWFWKKW